MRPSTVLLLSLPVLLAGFCVTGARAQAPAVATAPESDCRVGMFARQQGAGVTLWTTSLEDRANPLAPREPKSGVHVVVSAREPRETIREVTLRVTYLPYGLRALPTDSVQPAASSKEATRTFHLSAADGGSLRLAGDLLLGRVSGVRKVAIEKIEFADGHSWTAPAANPCSVEPSGLLLLAAH